MTKYDKMNYILTIVLPKQRKIRKNEVANISQLRGLHLSSITNFSNVALAKEMTKNIASNGCGLMKLWQKQRMDAEQWHISVRLQFSHKVIVGDDSVGGKFMYQTNICCSFLFILSIRRTWHERNCGPNSFTMLFFPWISLWYPVIRHQRTRNTYSCQCICVEKRIVYFANVMCDYRSNDCWGHQARICRRSHRISNAPIRNRYTRVCQTSFSLFCSPKYLFIFVEILLCIRLCLAIRWPKWNNN